MTTDLDLRDPKLRRLHIYWRGLRQDGVLPSRRDMDPVDIPDLLPFVQLVDVAHGPLDLSFRLLGTELVDKLGRDYTGWRLADCYADKDWPGVEAYYEFTIRRHSPCLAVLDLERRDGRRYICELLLLPLSSDKRSVDMVLGGVAFLKGEVFDEISPEIGALLAG